MIYAIGDVHGEADALREMLVKLPVEPSDLGCGLGDRICDHAYALSKGRKA